MRSGGACGEVPPTLAMQRCISSTFRLKFQVIVDNLTFWKWICHGLALSSHCLRLHDTAGVETLGQRAMLWCARPFPSLSSSVCKSWTLGKS
jgi:hypothetical protein